MIYYSPDTYYNFANQTVKCSQVVIYILFPLIQHSYSYIVQLTFKQHGLNWIGPLVHGFFFNRKYNSTTWSMVSWIHGCGTEGAELWIWRADYKLEGDFQLCWWVGPWHLCCSRVNCTAIENENKNANILLITKSVTMIRSLSVHSQNGLHSMQRPVCKCKVATEYSQLKLQGSLRREREKLTCQPQLFKFSNESVPKTLWVIALTP